MKKIAWILVLLLVLLGSGCAKESAEVPQVSPPLSEYAAPESSEPEQKTTPNYDDYLTSLKEKSDSIKDSLEYDALTQTDMNMKSQELYELWDDALNYVWNELRIKLPEEEFARLQDEQRIWLAEREAAVEAAGKEFEGGSIYPLVVNSEAARITEERVCRLFTLLKESAE